ncbi:MAG: hypothetical protein ACLTDR_07230 [Adlercreutzia equolifaciens]
MANQCTDAILGVPGVARASCGFKCDLDIEVMGRAACIALADGSPSPPSRCPRGATTRVPIDSMRRYEPRHREVLARAVPGSGCR